MMKVLAHHGLAAWLDALAGASMLIAPTAAGERTFFRPVRSSAEIVLGTGKTDLSPKEYFLPPTQALFHIRREKDGLKLQEPSLGDQHTIWAVRPCDARALRILDALFLATEPIDPYYAQRRANTTLIGLACAAMGEECFCTSMGVQPDDPQDVDVMLTAVEEGYAVQVVTEKGRRITEGLSLETAEGLPLKPSLREDRVPVPEAGSWPNHFDHSIWARLSERCLSCKLCAYVCPTCRCFDVRDEERQDGEITRLRAWDSCMAEGYRRIAGGHNPRPTKRERLRNRFYCKFCYYPQDWGSVACVGCGRCIARCPANVDVVEVLRDVAAM